VFVGFGSYSDIGNYHGWLFAFDAATLTQRAVWNASPNAEGSAIWQGGGAPAFDGAGNIYLETADGHNPDGVVDFGDSFVKLQLAGNAFTVLDWFRPYNADCLDTKDLDLGSGAPTLLPDDQGNGVHPHLAFATSKEGRVYLLDRDNLGKFNAGADTQVPDWKLLNSVTCEKTDGSTSPASANNTLRIYSSGTYWNGHLYVATANGNMHSFQIQNATLAEVGHTATDFDTRSPIGVVSASGNTNGILWAAERNSTGHGILHAWDALNVTNELWNSDMNGARDGLANAQVFTTPVAINGNVYVANSKNVTAFGLLK
jgi:hypothetical protein